MLSPLFDFLLEGGVPRDTLVTLLMFPIVAALIVAARQIVGIKSFGIYTPLIITFAFLEIDIKYGAVIFIVSLLVATMMRILLRNLRILYLPKMALILSITVLTMFLILIEAAFSDRTVVANLSVYQVLIIITLVEKFINVQIEKGYRTASILATETLALSTIGYLIVASPAVQDFVFDNPAIILFFFVVIIFLGRYEGLRINEYFRFRNLFKNLP
jgi:hypothetical protein